ncbi:ABC transporter permease [Rhodoferax sp.]|uniref:ABC transporter permease n=1 Tax=Rhodoferax sp. TaxID=50421 RepID=UPI002619F1BA|nr:ABC transporter permease [Rhodoferax sp.]MDD2924077.1 ABC transporter permease [Rhodoferax sp.]
MMREPNLLASRGHAMIAVAALIFLYIPIFTLVALSFNANDLTTIWSGLSIKWYVAVLDNGDILQAAKNSLIVASIATTLATAAATATALGVVRAGTVHRGVVEGLLSLPLLVPEIVTAVALLMLFVLGGVPLGLVSVILAHTVFCIPFAYYPIRSRLAGLDPALIEAAADLYAPPWKRFTRVELPLLSPGIFAGALLAFISSLGDFVITYFVAGPGATTLPVYIFGMIRTGITPEVNALSAIFLLVSMVVITTAFWVTQRLGESGSKAEVS